MPCEIIYHKTNNGFITNTSVVIIRNDVTMFSRYIPIHAQCNAQIVLRGQGGVKVEYIFY